jgi:hypothetical protein
MILAANGGPMARCSARPGDLPAQSAPEGRLPDADPTQPDAVHIRAVRRQLKRGEAGLHPGSHHALGLAAYAQVTPPLRRYQDLALHRQIVAVLEGRPPEHDAAAMQAILASTERRRDRWPPRRARDGPLLDAAMARTIDRSNGDRLWSSTSCPRPIVVPRRDLLEQPVPSLVGAATGDRVRLTIERVNPRADLLVPEAGLNAPTC